MQGLMMGEQLTITSLMRHGRSINGDSKIVSVVHDNPRHEYTQADCYDRAGQLAFALRELGLEPGQTVGTLAWNDYRHMEVYYGAIQSTHGYSQSNWSTLLITPKISFYWSTQCLYH